MLKYEYAYFYCAMCMQWLLSSVCACFVLQVLPCIHRMMGSKRIPFDHLVLIHLDSHSDLSVPLSLDADLIFNKEHLYRYFNINLSHSITSETNA